MLKGLVSLVILLHCCSFAVTAERKGLFTYLNPREYSFFNLLFLKADDLVVITVATHVTDGFTRFNRSINLYGLKQEVLFGFVIDLT